MNSNKPKIEESPRTAYLCHLAFWFGPLFATPVFVALHNRQDIVFSSAWLAAWTALACLLVSLLGWKMAQRLPAAFQWWLNRILLTVAFITAIQSNLVYDFFYYGAFNGEKTDLRAYGMTFWLEWYGYLAGLLLALFLSSRIVRLSAWMPSLPILSFALLLIPALLAATPGEPTASAEDEIDSSVFAFSSKNNLIHLLPDGLQGDVVREVFQQNPELAAQFEGFTQFTDHISLYQATAPSLFTILTGAPFDLDKGYSNKRVTARVQKDAYQNQLLGQGFQIDFVPISPYICVKGSNSCYSRPFSTMMSRGYFRHHNENRSYSARLIADLTLFRLVPMFLKEKIYDQGNWFFADTTLGGFSPWPDPVIREWTDRLYVTDDKPVYKWYHFIGGHIPAQWDRQCRLHRGLEHNRENYKAQTYCVLSDIGNFLARLKREGIYEQTAVLISGDHGHNITPDDLTSPPRNGDLYPGLLGSGRPALLIKQRNSRKPLTFSTAPTSLLDVAPTALALAGIETEAETVFDLKEGQSRVRQFIPYSIEDFWSGNPVPYVRYTIDGASNDGSRWTVTGIRSLRSAPEAYDPINYENAQNLMFGAVLEPDRPDNDSAWVKGQQLSFLIDVPKSDPEPSLQLILHLPEWIPEQTLRIQVNNANAGEPSTVYPAKAFWQDLVIRLQPEQLLDGRNFMSILFDQTYQSPQFPDFHAAALLKSIRVTSAPQTSPEAESQASSATKPQD